MIEELKEGRFSGTLLTREDKPIRYAVYKKRLPNPDANKGESGGYRAIYLVEHDNRYIAFLAIYYKAEQETVSDAYIGGLVDGILMDYSR